MMRGFSRVGIGTVFAGSLVAATAANASSVTAIYNTLTAANPDVEGVITGVETGLVQKTLGPDALPVESTPGTFGDVNTSGELLWWTPNSIGSTPVVIAGTTYTYPNPATLPFNITSDFFPNGPGGSNGGDIGYTSVELKGTFVTPTGGSVTFSLGSDDDAWVFLNGQLVVDDGGVHALATAPTLLTNLAPGTNTVEVFMADRHVVQAGLYFDADVTLNPAVPEASTWAMMLCGFSGLGYFGYRARTRRAANTGLSPINADAFSSARPRPPKARGRRSAEAGRPMA
jgi:fibro-slime domain-containing protein